jgi:hypothetical protein
VTASLGMYLIKPLDFPMFMCEIYFTDGTKEKSQTTLRVDESKQYVALLSETKRMDDEVEHVVLFFQAI